MHFNAKIKVLLNFFWSSKVVLLNIVEFLIMSAKIATGGFLK